MSNILELLQVQNLTLTLKKKDLINTTINTTLVKNISFNILSGECLALIGESGSGKSLSALAITGLLPSNIQISTGKIIFSQKTISQYSDKDYLKIRGSQIAMIFQEPMTALNPVFSIGEQIKETLLVHDPEKQKLSSVEINQEISHWLKQVQITDPERVAKQYPFELSGGLRQRAMIAMAICGKPKLLIADEPTTALDVTTQKEILELLKKICQENKMALLLITHDFGIVSNYAERVCVLHRGNLVETNEVQQILFSPQEIYTQSLLKAIPLMNRKYQKKDRLYSNSPDSRRIINTDFLESYQQSQEYKQLITKKSATKNILTVKNLKIHYPIYKGLLRQQVNKIKALDDVSFTVKQGQIFGIVGESGCGKSTLARSLVRLEKITAGEIYYQDTNYTFLKNKQLAPIRKKIQIIFQDSFSAFNPRLTALEILSEPLHLYRKVSGKNTIRECRKLLDLVALDAKSLYRYPHEFSGGQRQRLAIARALALHPRVLIADESVSALDVSIQAQILNLLKDIQQELGLTILFVSHDLAVIKYMSEEMIVLSQGKIVEQGATAKIISNPQQEYTKKLLFSNLLLPQKLTT